MEDQLKESHDGSSKEAKLVRLNDNGCERNVRPKMAPRLPVTEIGTEEEKTICNDGFSCRHVGFSMPVG